MKVGLTLFDTSVLRFIQKCTVYLLLLLLLSCELARGCGQSSVAPSLVAERVLGGSAARANSWPWQALLSTFNRFGYGISCGATVISDRWLLTAAHCIQIMNSDTYVQLGTIDSTDFSHVYSISHQMVHPGYDSVNVINDLALIQTSIKIHFNERIQPICLALDDTNLTAPGTYGFITGFGIYIDPATRKLSTDKSNCLLQTRVPFIAQNECRAKWYLLTAGGTKITDNEVCAGSYLHGTAPGDSGGPLQVQSAENGRWYQVGITSFGAQGLNGLLDQFTYPGVYTRVSAYIGWINKTTSNQFNSHNSSQFLHSKTHLHFFLLVDIFLIFILHCKIV